MDTFGADNNGMIEWVVARGQRNRLALADHRNRCGVGSGSHQYRNRKFV